MTAAAEPEPAAAAQLFGDRIELARSYASELVRRGEELGLIGPLEIERIWTRHVGNCALVADLIKPGLVADIGSGAGLPGLVLAIARPNAQFVLIEPMERRADWLRSEVARLGLTNATVERSRAEDVRPKARFDQITARAVASLAKLIPLTAPLLRPGGEALFMKGRRAFEEVEAARTVLSRAGMSRFEVLTLGSGILPEETRVFRATVD